MNPELQHTARGFEFYEFEDGNGNINSLQQSSAIGEYEDAWDRPGSSFVWLGVYDEEIPRMHLDRDQVAWLRDRLSNWLETGSFEKETDK